MEQLGRPLIILGVVIIVVGFLLTLGPKLPLGLGKLNFHWQRGNFNFYFPLGTLIVINVILAIIISLFSRR
jgi:hypothetical protein